MRVAKLEGYLLNYWVAKAEGLRVEIRKRHTCERLFAYIFIDTAVHKGYPRIYSPSSDWSEGGEIIDRERIHIEPFPGGDEYPEWLAFERSDGWGEPPNDSPRRQYGDTALIAAMRAYVASKFGEEVPDIDAQPGSVGWETR